MVSNLKSEVDELRIAELEVGMDGKRVRVVEYMRRRLMESEGTRKTANCRFPVICGNRDK